MINDELLTSPRLLSEAIYESVLEVYAESRIQQAFMTLPPVDMVKNGILADAVRLVLNRLNIDMPEEIYRWISKGVQEKFTFQPPPMDRGIRPRSVTLNFSPLARNLIVTGEPPVDGEDGDVIPHFDLGFAPGRLLAGSGKAVDLKEIQKAPQTADNELLLHIYMPTQGAHGTDIFGEPIPAKAGAPCAVSLGEGVVKRSCPPEEAGRPRRGVYSILSGIIIAECKDGIRKPSNLNKISILNKINILPIDLSGANISTYSNELKCMADTFVQGDIRGPLSIMIKGDLVVNGSIECKNVEVSGRIKARMIKTEARAKEDIDIAIASNAILQSNKTITITRELVHSKIDTELLIVKPNEIQEVLCAYLEITADKVEMNKVSIRNIVKINLGGKKFKEIVSIKEKTTKIIASLNETVKDIREKIIISVEKIKSTIIEGDNQEKKILGLILDTLVGMIKGNISPTKTKDGIESWIMAYGQQFYTISKQLTQLLPLLENYSAYQLEFQKSGFEEKEILDTLQSIRIDIKGSILPTGTIVIMCNDEEIKFGCRPQSLKDGIDVSLTYSPGKGLRSEGAA